MYMNMRKFEVWMMEREELSLFRDVSVVERSRRLRFGDCTGGGCEM